MSHWMKFIGNTVESPTDGSPVVLELKILGIVYRPKNLAEIVTYYGGEKQRGYVPELSFDIQFEDFSTVEGSEQNTNDVAILEQLSNMPFVYLSKPESPKMLPPRWRHSTGFSELDYFEEPIHVVLDGDISLQKKWGSAKESLEVTYTSAN